MRRPHATHVFSVVVTSAGYLGGARSTLDGVIFRLVRTVLRLLTALPVPVKRLLAGRVVRDGGQRLDVDIQLLLRVFGAAARWGEAPPLTEQRRLTDAAADLAEQVAHGVVVERATIPTPDGRPLAACVYTPQDAAHAPSGVLVFLHGGGFVLGSLVSGDPLCRTLAQQAGARVVSVDYRLAPEHPFPAGLSDAVTALRHVLAGAAADGIPVAVGGDSAGANLALTAAHELARAGEPTAAFVLAMYPVTDVERHRGSRETFATGFGLRADEIDAFEHAYLPDGSDPIRSTGLLEADDLALMPPTYVATAGFDPLRDEGEELADALVAAGVPTIARRFPGLVHGYAGFNGLSRAAHDAVLDAASALRAGLALTVRPGSGTPRWGAPATGKAQPWPSP